MAETTTQTATEGTTAGTEAHGGEHGGGIFPPLDQSTFPSQLLWLVIFFAALYFLMSRLALPKIGKIIEDRQATIDADLARAQTLKDETEGAIKSYEKALGDARSRATDIARETRGAVTKDVEAEQHKLDASLAAKISEAETRIAQSKAKALESVDDIASDAAADIIASLTGSKVSKAAVAKALKG